MKLNLNYLIAFLLGFAAYYAYDFKRSVTQQVNYAVTEAQVKALMPLCGSVFKGIVKEEKK